MKLIKNLLKTLTVAFCGALLLASCKGAIDNPGQGKAYLRATANQAERSTLFPAYELSDFTSYTLLGTYSEETSPIELGNWESYEDFASAYIAIPKTGEWDFVLDAYTSEGTYFSAKVENVTIIDGANSINFPLKAKEYAIEDSTQKGGFSVSFELAGANFNVESNYDYEYDFYSPDYSVSATIKKGEDLASAEIVESKNLSLELLPKYDSEGNELSDSDRFGYFSGLHSFTGDFIATAEKDNLDSGYYWVIFSVNKGTFEGIITKSVFVTVADGKITTEKAGTSVTEIVNTNDVIAKEAEITFTISYSYNGGSIIEDDDYTPPTSYCSRDTEATVLPTADNIAREGYIFLGWAEVFEDDSTASEYTTELLSKDGNIVEGNREYKAIWQWDSSQEITIAKNGENGTYDSQTFSWYEVPGADMYEIYTKAAEDEEWSYSAGVTDTFFSILPSFNNAKFYAVKAYNEDENVYSDNYSNTIVYSQLTSLSAPEVTKTNNVLSWNPVYGATEYRIYMCDNETQLSNEAADEELECISSITDITSLSFEVSSKFEKYVYYAVKAYNSIDGEESTYRQLWDIPKAPAPYITYSNGVLSWNEINEATGYIIYSYESTTQYDTSSIATVKANLSTEISKGSSSFSYEKTNQSATKYLYLAVKAIKYPLADNTTGYTDYSNIITINPKDFTPPVLTVENTETQGEKCVTWEEVEGATGGYKVYYYSSSEEVSVNDVLTNGDMASTQNNFYTLNLNSTTNNYYVVVKPYNTYDNVAGDASDLATISPLNLSFSSESTLQQQNTEESETKRISWDEVADANGYKVYYCSSSNNSLTGNDIVANNTFYTTENTYYDFTNLSTSNYLYVVVQPYFYSSYYNDTYYGTLSSVSQIDYIHLPDFSSSVEPVSLSWSNSEGKAYISFSETADYTYIYKYSSTSDLALDTFDASLLTDLFVVCSSASNYEITLPEEGTYDYYAVRNGDDDATSESFSNVIKVYSNVNALVESHTGTYYFTNNGSETWTSNNKNRQSSSAVSTWQTSTSADMIYYSYDWTVSSESSWDKLTITQGGTTVVNLVSGSQSNTISGFTSGDLNIQATYSKDNSTDRGSDCGTLTFTQLYFFFD